MIIDVPQIFTMQFAHLIYVYTKYLIKYGKYS